MSDQKHEQSRKLTPIGRRLVIFATAFILFLFIFSFLMMPQEYLFLKKADGLFQESGRDIILIKDITEFPWDTVCYLGVYTDVDDLAPYIGTSSIRGQTNFHRYWPFFVGAFWFFADGKLVEKMSYSSGGLQITSNGIKPTGFSLNGDWYRFFSESSFEGDRCYDYQVAAFVMRKGGRGSNLVIFTSKKGK